MQALALQRGTYYKVHEAMYGTALFMQQVCK